MENDHEQLPAFIVKGINNIVENMRACACMESNQTTFIRMLIITVILTHLAYRANGNKLWYIGQ